ncbi:FAD-binding domain-containing protein [Mycena venus]|uniref:FAD-binding domain-containing protein n=1 Tax=Mycena venus TaxID=2733690 RepID=A0A8H6YXN6_9AGAR|nr:FAD-binding domain-containing protein [Mycena venus]
MKFLNLSLVYLSLVLPISSSWAQNQNNTSLKHAQACRNVPGSPGYPTPAAWDAFNATISGRLIKVVPSAVYCANLPGGSCTDAQWTSALFRSMIPGAADQVNWEQGYDLTPPALCLRNSTNTCKQGDVPLYSVEAETVADVQAAVKFASAHNLRLVLKSSGHDTLGRSSARQALLIRTTNFQNLTFTDAFYIGGQNQGPAVTVGSGARGQDLYRAGKANGRAVLGGSAGTVCIAGGYIQGAGHSALSPLFGLAADNVLGALHLCSAVRFGSDYLLSVFQEFNIIVASGELLKVNSVSHSDLFFALRGGGSGSWGVLISATFKNYPTFNSTSNVITFRATNNTAAGALATAHAHHIFDLDSSHASHSWIMLQNATDNTTSFEMNANIPHTTIEESKTLLAAFMNASLVLPGVSLVSEEYGFGDINDALFQADDAAGTNSVLGSRLIPAETYRQSPEKVGQVYKELLDIGTQQIFGIVVAGGKVAENADIESAVHPAWRKAKTHFVIHNFWDDSAPLSEINAIRKKFTTLQRPVVEQLSGPNPGSYSNEADIFEPQFQTTFYGPNYAKLSAIKARYDPEDLFIVARGVGSERWDEWALCRA